MRNSIIEKMITTYFAKLNTTSGFKQILELKELCKFAVTHWILCAVSDRGFALTLKGAAKNQNLYLQKETPITVGENVYVSISSEKRGDMKAALDVLKDQCVRLLEQGLHIVADNKLNAMRPFNRDTEGELYTYLLSKGYKVDDTEYFAYWYKNEDVKHAIYKGVGSSLEYVCKLAGDVRWFAGGESTIRFTRDEIKFFHFCGRDIERLNEILKGRLVLNKFENKEDYYSFRPDQRKYEKSYECAEHLLNYIRKGGMAL